MIRIRYRDLAPGLHGKVERCARGVTVYLLPGLTGKQRKAVLRRLRQEASRGCGPGLPTPQLAVALGADWIRTNLKNTAAVVRLHPAGSLLPAAWYAAVPQRLRGRSPARAPGRARPRGRGPVPVRHKVRRDADRAWPKTAHRPGPRDFAW